MHARPTFRRCLPVLASGLARWLLVAPAGPLRDAGRPVHRRRARAAAQPERGCGHHRAAGLRGRRAGRVARHRLHQPGASGAPADDQHGQVQRERGCGPHVQRGSGARHRAGRGGHRGRHDLRRDPTPADDLVQQQHHGRVRQPRVHRPARGSRAAVHRLPGRELEGRARLPLVPGAAGHPGLRRRVLRHQRLCRGRGRRDGSCYVADNEMGLAVIDARILAGHMQVVSYLTARAKPWISRSTATTPSWPTARAGWPSTPSTAERRPSTWARSRWRAPAAPSPSRTGWRCSPRRVPACTSWTSATRAPPSSWAASSRATRWTSASPTRHAAGRRSRRGHARAHLGTGLP